MEPAKARPAECRAALGDLLAAIVPAASTALASALIEEFGSLAATLSASPERLARICGAEVAGWLRAVRRAQLHSARAELLERPILSGTADTTDYLRARLAHQRVEQVLVLFLDTRNRLLRDEIVSSGTLGATALDCRAITARALELGAVSIILAHNHPSGDPTPSNSDVRATRGVVSALNPFDIVLLDHFVIGRAGCASFRAMGLL